MPPLRYFVPNGITALSLVLGLASIAMSVDGNFELAAWMILWGTLLDKLDGSAARLLSATSRFGIELDSFADFVSFGIAPAALFYFRIRAFPAEVLGPNAAALRIAAAVGAALYVVALAVRLARFNITTSDEGVFYGIPGTMMGAILGSGYLTWAKYHLSESLLSYGSVVLIVGAVAMVSTIRLPKLKMRKNKAFNAFQIVNVLAAYVCGPLRLFPEYLFGLALTYLLGGVTVGLLARPGETATAKALAPESDLAEDEAPARQSQAA